MGCYTSKPCIYLPSSSTPTISSSTPTTSSSTPTSSPFHSSYALDIINLATKWIHVFLKNENQHLTDSLALHLKQFIAKTLYIVTTSIYNKKLIDFCITHLNTETSPLVSVGSGVGIFETYVKLTNPDKQFYCIDPLNTVFKRKIDTYPNNVLFTPQYKTIEKLKKKNPVLFSKLYEKCCLIFIWPMMGNSTYDYDAIETLKPKKFMMYYEFLGAACGLKLLRWLKHTYYHAVYTFSKQLIINEPYSFEELDERETLELIDHMNSIRSECNSMSTIIGNFNGQKFKLCGFLFDREINNTLLQLQSITFDINSIPLWEVALFFCHYEVVIFQKIS